MSSTSRSKSRSNIPERRSSQISSSFDLPHERVMRRNISRSNTRNLPPPTEEATSSVSNISSHIDVDDILEQIKEQLSRFDSVDDIDFGNIEDDTYQNITLEIDDDSKITVLCMLHIMSGSGEFLQEHSEECLGNISKYITEGDRLNLADLMKLSGNFDRDKNFYIDLYRFTVTMAKFLAYDERFITLRNSQKGKIILQNILDSLGSFISEVLRYFEEFIASYDVMEEPLISTSYNLLLLLNSVTYSRANLGVNISQLSEVYDDLMSAVRGNISIYKNIRDGVFSSLSKISPDTHNEMSDLINKLRMRLERIENQRNILEENLNVLSRESSNMRQVINNNGIINLADNLERVQD